MHDLSEDSLIKLAQQNSHEAFEHLYELYLPYVRRTIYSMLREIEAIDDIAQEVFIAVYLDLPGFRGDSKFSTWLTSIIRSKVHRHLRHFIKHKVDYSEEFHSFCSQSENQEHELCIQEERSLLKRLIDQLPDHLSDVARLRLKDHSTAQIAEKLNVTENAVKLRHQKLIVLLAETWRDQQTDFERSSNDRSSQ